MVPDTGKRGELVMATLTLTPREQKHLSDLEQIQREMQATISELAWIEYGYVGAEGTEG